MNTLSEYRHLLSANRMPVVVLLVAGTLTSFINALGMSLVPTGRWEVGPLTLIGLTVVGIPFWVVAYGIATLLYTHFAGKKLPGPLRFVENASVPQLAGILIVFWLPYLLVFYPGTANMDTVLQIRNFLGDDVKTVSLPSEGFRFKDANPLLDTLVYGAVVYFSSVVSQYLPLGAVNAGWNLGMALLALTQIVGTAFAVAYAVSFFRGFDKGRSLTLIAYVMFALLPVYPMYAICVVKDSTQVPFFIVFFVMFAKILHTRGAVLSSWKWAVGFSLTLLMFVLTKKTGEFVLLLVVLLMLFAIKSLKFRVRFLASTGAVLFFMHTVMPFVVFPLLNVEPGQKAESLGPLYQATAAYVSAHPQQVTAEEKAVIDRILKYDTLAERYDFSLSDPVKNRSNFDATEDEFAAYYKVWLKQLAREPATIVGSLIFPILGFVSDQKQVGFYYEAGKYQAVKYPAVLKPARDFVFHATQWYPKAGATAAFGSVAFYTLWIPVASLVIALIRTRRWPVTAYWIPIVASLVLLAPSPVTSTRYALNLIWVAPLLLLLPLVGAQEKTSTHR
ncbi:hypothetical protein J2S49_001792 [Arcanobacterium wilhelmae]|uniref:Glycosyltransferase RgtA/B/C/D-like domain-containing protein n=1 Tax=Arcanobacterium wilhelmae TaxID=1803177 RepID=A0ABT9NDB7_9ACTO|nr:DUF6020 family protein [Arcanobacterium wilhelmae]MDP9801716.1 hypothetical protein [Arcanobacterium wilhelmae]